MTIRRQQGSKRWGIYDGHLLVEGGFFSRQAAANHAAIEYGEFEDDAEDEHEAAHRRGPVDSRVCQGIGCPYGDR